MLGMLGTAIIPNKTKKPRIRMVPVISRLLLHGILSVNSPCACIRLKGMFVISLRGFIRGFGTKTTHFLPTISLSSLQGQNLSSLSLYFIQLFHPVVDAIMLHVREWD